MTALERIAEFEAALDAFIAAREPPAIRDTLRIFHEKRNAVAQLVVEDRANYFLVHSAFMKADAKLDRAMEELGI